ncbi:ammonium transporter Rh type A [Plutella xylostella]|uniref:ammonium transporter Rh type A n=1 Tax=Plutella xylostella TaxID=51655 RepID=UPI0020327DE8|nr:ammonium transporter Rh type A [Plutella xylostella]
MNLHMQRGKFAAVLLFQIALAIAFCFLSTEQKREPHGEHGSNNSTESGASVNQDEDNTQFADHAYLDVHTMVFVGFAFLMTFLKKYSFTAAGGTLVFAALIMQWALFCQQIMFGFKGGVFPVTVEGLLEADVMTAAVLISFGAILGAATIEQVFFIGIVETAVGCANLYLFTNVLQANDVGGSISIHTFGAYFGLACSAGLRLQKLHKPSPNVEPLNGSSYSSDTFAMIGTLFLWVYWPAFNGALAPNRDAFERGIINTYLSIAASAVTAFCVSSLLHKEDKLEMVHIQNATLAGGVGIGTIATLVSAPAVAIAVGVGCGAVSVLGYEHITPKLSKLGVLDTCGVNNLHGLPGLTSGVLSIILFAATRDGASLARLAGQEVGGQALRQLFGLLATLGVAVVSGAVTGFVAKKLFKPLKPEEAYSDEKNWVLPEY